ncbi:mannose-1-phosphate guanylyltransferase/mannose-6-phosphate isomerase [Sphingomonas sp.]|jgi:mannose-1-phosphate guanylyltransferase/mannose-1-phosphate guanylyltransferase/mannose-6-phosphate isomerase|uniref:mannose-1-phosphate guanylyltransferase/mannose-6-phosphate isomerase n=1 Tax=Sphingomonas sp. TaxID=28214 RepID=UPI002DF33B6F|nr:mannose-1-phosphate guanylyltransferase/mannose-6-phosphate isomerase [Sphingomonas sp.]HEV2568153.1 mannose-1-phosphate guanylyltransferase/mannose-6-phosphate isomerase [Sphingomonas sp.]
MTEQRVVPVILSGGGGTRLWPLSRPDKPKQFLVLASEQTMLQATAARTADRTRYAPPLIVANAAHADEIEGQLQAIGCGPQAIILEPVARNTAAAIALAALSASAEAILLIMPSDHVIAKPEALHEAVAAGLPFAEQDWLVTFGVTPTHAETGYGYIKLAEPLDPRVHRVERFIEKPLRPAAESMLAEGGYAWNGGIFLFKAGALLQALAELAPQVLAQAREALEAAVTTGVRIQPQAEAFAACPSESIDYAVMEKAGKVAVVPVDLGWSDVGSWDALYDLGPRDPAGNLIKGAARLVDTSNCLVRSEGPRVSMLGVSDLIVIATGDEILIMPRGQSQEVKRLSGP